MKKYDGMVFERDESKVRFIPAPMIPIMGICWLAAFFFIIGTAYFFIRQDYDFGIRSLLILGVVLVFGFACDRFDWQHHVKWVFDNRDAKKAMYVYDLDPHVMPVADIQVEIRFKSVEKVRSRGHDIIVYGIMEKRMPMSAPKIIKKFKAKDVPENHEEIMRRLNEMVNL